MSDLIAAANTTQASPFYANLASLSSSLTLQHRNSHGRSEVEALIHSAFLTQHQANVQHFLPQLLSLRCLGSLSAAVGLQSAANSRLFLEQYLTQPIEQILSHHSDEIISRDQILEIGNLVSIRSGSSLLLMVALSELIAKSRFRWVTFTATSEVQSLLSKLHYQPITLTDANPTRLYPGQEWGAYYKKQPKVMAGLALPAISSARTMRRYQLMQHVLSPQLASLQRMFNDLSEAI